MDTILFDLDGTLLPMDMDAFMHAYFSELCKKCAPAGYEPRRLVDAVLAGLDAMQTNDGEATNEERFMAAASKIVGDRISQDKPLFRDFYLNEFSRVKGAVEPTPLASKCIKALKKKGYQLVLATNAVFPKEATLARIEWAGLNKNDFILITTYEDFHYAKPNLGYYEQILDRIGRNATDCMMVGNDVREDMCVRELGMDTFLVTDCLINKDKVDISQFKHGSLAEFYEYIQSLPEAGKR